MLNIKRVTRINLYNEITDWIEEEQRKANPNIKKIKVLKRCRQEIEDKNAFSTGLKPKVPLPRWLRSRN